MGPAFFFGGNISPNFNLKILIFNLSKGFLNLKQNANSPDFEGKIKCKLPDFYDKFQ